MSCRSPPRTGAAAPEVAHRQPTPTKVPQGAPQPESSAAHSATALEVESLMRHQVRKASLANPVFFDKEFNALQSVDAQLGAACLGLKEANNVLAAGLKVKF